MSLLIHTPFLDGVRGSHATGMGILGVEYQKAQLGGAGREFLLHSWKRKGDNRASFAD